MSNDLTERPDRLQLVRFADLVTRAPAPWSVRGFLREQSVAMLYGRRGCYKSFLALDLAASIATGTEWHGYPIVAPGLVIYVAGEGGGGMVQRSRAWSEQHGILPNRINLQFITEPVIITGDSLDLDLLVHRIQQAIDWYPEGTIDQETGHQYDSPVAREWPVLIVIDTLARCFLGDENKQEDMGMFIQGLDRLKMEFNCSLLVLHHTGLNESRERGSTSLGGACDTIYRVDADKDLKTLTLTNEKMKDSREPEPLTLSYREVQVARRPLDEPNEDLTSVIIESGDPDGVVKQAEMLQILKEAGPLTWADWFGSTDLSKTSFYRYMMELKKSGQIIKEKGKWGLIGSTTKKYVEPN